MKIIFIFIASFWSILAYPGESGTPFDAHPFYVGLNGGYGSTTWKGLVPSHDKQSIVLNISTPTDVHEGGWVWGGVAGFEFSPFVGVEVNYLSYPKAEIFIWNTQKLKTKMHLDEQKCSSETAKIRFCFIRTQTD